MNPERQRILIAEACNPQYKDTKIEWWYTQEDDYSKDYVWPIKGPCETIQCIVVPDYLNDLNAMHEAEKVLTDDQFSVYGRHLLRLTENNRPYWGSTRVAIATAAQRAEAFLKTLALWKDIAPKVTVDWSGCETTEAAKIYFDQPEVKKAVGELAQSLADKIDEEMVDSLVKETEKKQDG